VENEVEDELDWELEDDLDWEWEDWFKV